MSERAIEFDTLLDVCRDKQRRIVLAVLADQRRSLTLNDLTKTITKHNHHTSITKVSEEVHTNIRDSLYHVHIPKLEAAGIIEYDPDRGLVEPTEQFYQVQTSLSAILDADPMLETPVEL